MSDIYVIAIKQPDSQYERGLEIDLGCIHYEPEPNHECCKKWEGEWEGDGIRGLEIDLDRLPDGVKIIRVVEPNE